jgi:hypothetical protein
MIELRTLGALEARDSYRFVVDVWRHADPALEPYVRETRAGLERMVTEQ